MKIPQELEKYGLVYAKPPVKRRMVATGEGGPGVGKTDLFYRTAPRPALVIQLDLNDEGVRERYMADEDIVFKDVIIPATVGQRTDDNVAADNKIYTQVRDLYKVSVTKGYFRSIMIDEGVQLYELVKRAFIRDLGFGGTSRPSYAPVNSAMKRFYTLAKQNRVNVYIPHRQKDEREDGFNEETQKKTSELTGRKTIGGWKDALYESQVHILLEKDPTFSIKDCDDCGYPKKAPGVTKYCTCDKFVKKNPLRKFKATIKKCTPNTAVEGKVFVGEAIDWVTIGMTVYPHSEEEEWR